MTWLRSIRPGRVGLYFLALLLALWTLLPVYIITVGAFSRPNDVYEYPLHLYPHHPSISTLRFFVDSAGIIPALERSIWVLGMTLGIALAVGVPAGYALARFRFRGSNMFQLSVVGTRAFPIIILAVPLLVTFKTWGIADSILGVSLVHVALALPLVILTTAGIFSGIAIELEEAAMTLGCTRFSAICRIVLPLALPGLAAAAIFVALLSWNEVFAASTLTLLHRTLPAQVLSVLNQALLPFRLAGGFFLLAPALLIVFIIRRFLFSMWGVVVK
jgi:multiple sugar transport system permease protein